MSTFLETGVLSQEYSVNGYSQRLSMPDITLPEQQLTPEQDVLRQQFELARKREEAIQRVLELLNHDKSSPERQVFDNQLDTWRKQAEVIPTSGYTAQDGTTYSYKNPITGEIIHGSWIKFSRENPRGDDEYLMADGREVKIPRELYDKRILAEDPFLENDMRLTMVPRITHGGILDGVWLLKERALESGLSSVSHEKIVSFPQPAPLSKAA